MTHIITPSLENYLEGILIVQREKKVVRVKDLARFLKVKASSVIEAVSNLVKMGLVIHERYGYIELTQQGVNLAKEIYERHNTLKKFFRNVLGIEEKIAEEDACKIEHYLSKKTIERILNFIKFIETCPETTPEWLGNFFYFVKHKKRPSFCRTRVMKEGKIILKLSQLKVGEKAKIVKVIDTGILKRKLLDMGLVKEEKIKVKKVAPLGSPIDVLVKNTHLSLRKEEAEKILVELER